jgi:hypothetical protein
VVSASAYFTDEQVAVLARAFRDGADSRVVEGFRVYAGV